MKPESIKAADAKAANCDKERACLKPDCTISDTVRGKILFTETRHPMGRSYQHAFGNTFICTCPVRKELFKNQNI
jgi:hypothetical protein